MKQKKEVKAVSLDGECRRREVRVNTGRGNVHGRVNIVKERAVMKQHGATYQQLHHGIQNVFIW